MATLHIDITDGSGGVYDKDGWRFDRIAKVTGVPGVGQAQIKNAVDSLIAAVGDIGSDHPTVSSCKLRGYTPTSVANGIVTVKLTYKDEDTEVDSVDPEDIDIRVGTSVSQVQTNKDKDGVLITVAYTYPTDYMLDIKKRGQTFVQGVMMSKMNPGTTLTCTRTESSSPAVRSRLYTGKVNEAGWEVDPDALARTWMCMGIEGNRDKATGHYRVTYSFQYRDDTWDEDAIFINPDDGKPPKDLVDSVGQWTPELVESIDFNGMALT